MKRVHSFRKNCLLSGAELVSALVDWYQEPLGRVLWNQTQKNLSETLEGVFGYHALWMGAWPEEMVHEDYARIQRHFRVLNGGRSEAARISSSQLPVESESIDLVVLMHALELHRDPHQLLREIDRVLVPEGRLLIIHYDPLSWYGLARAFLRWSGHPPWCLPFYSGFRTRDWLSVLGYDEVETRGWGYTPPINRTAFLDRMGWYERFADRVFPFTGAVSMTHVVKRVATLTPIRNQWRPARSLISNGKIAEPTSRESGFVPKN